MLAIAPASAVRLDVGFGAFLECNRFGRIESRLQPLSTSCLDGVDTVMAPQAMLACPLARFDQADGVGRPHAHPPRPAIEHEAENPVLRAVFGDPQIKPSTVAVHSWLFCLVHLEGRELADRPRHGPTSNNYVHKYGADYDEGSRTCPEAKISRL